jgi:hypothetical protein
MLTRRHMLTAAAGVLALATCPPGPTNPPPVAEVSPTHENRRLLFEEMLNLNDRVAVIAHMPRIQVINFRLRIDVDTVTMTAT